MWAFPEQAVVLQTRLLFYQRHVLLNFIPFKFNSYTLDDVEQPTSGLAVSKSSTELKSHPIKGGWCITEYLTYDW